MVWQDAKAIKMRSVEQNLFKRNFFAKIKSIKVMLPELCLPVSVLKQQIL
jgi:hypothetical protein